MALLMARDCTAGGRYVTLLRDPISRVVSHLNHFFTYILTLGVPLLPREALRTADFFARVRAR